MRRRLALIALCSSLSGAAVAATPAFVDAYRVRVVAGFYQGTYESLALRSVASRAGPFWMAERRTRITTGVSGPTKHIDRLWIDGRSCPALGKFIEAIGKIPAPDASAPPPPFHGARTALATRKADGGYAVRSDYEGPITAWWWTSQETLKPCWSGARTTVDDGLLPLTLETDADEAPFIALERAN